MKLSLCNEVLMPMALEDQCAFVRKLGYDGLEIAPFTLADDPSTLSASEADTIRRQVEDHGLTVTSLHWLLVAPGGMNLTALEPDTADFTRKALFGLADLGARLGAKVLVLGSPAQRRLDLNPERQRQVAIDHIAALATHAERVGITCCLEAINSGECNFINRIDQAEAVIDDIGSPALKLMIDVCHAAQEEEKPLAQLARDLHAKGKLAHIQLNAINRQGPGQSTDPQGRDRIVELIEALVELGYDGAMGIEPFEYAPDGPAAAARAAGYVRGVMDAIGP